MLGQIRQMQGRADEAVMCQRKALELDPNSAATHANLGNALLDEGRVDDAVAEYDAALTLEPANPRIHSNLLIMLNYRDVDPQEVLERHVEWSRRHERPLANLIRLHDNDHDPDRPLRIGYVALFYQGNPTNYFAKNILVNHDRSTFHVIDYSVARHLTVYDQGRRLVG